MEQEHLAYMFHAGEDQINVARPVYEALRLRGINISSIFAIELIKKALDEASVFVFVLRPEFALKLYPMFELEYIMRRKWLLGGGDIQPLPTLVPVLYRLIVAQCNFAREFEQAQCDSRVRARFNERVAKGETSLETVLKHLRELTKYEGIVHIDFDGRGLPERIADCVTSVLLSIEPEVSTQVHAQILERALRDGKERLENVRLMVLGAPRRGKTSTLASLKGERFDDNRDSTVGIDLSIHHIPIGIHHLTDTQKEHLDKRDKFPARFRAFEEAQRNPLVYICHHFEERHTLALPIYESLQRRGLRAFLDIGTYLDSRRPTPNGDFAPLHTEEEVNENTFGSFEEAIKDFSTVVFLLSAEFALSTYTMRELEFILRLTLSSDGSTEQSFRPLLISVFYCLTVSECKYERQLEGVQCNPIVRARFEQRVAGGETSLQTVVENLKILTAYTGVENIGSALNDDSMGIAYTLGRGGRKNILANIRVSSADCLSA